MRCRFARRPSTRSCHRPSVLEPPPRAASPCRWRHHRMQQERQGDDSGSSKNGMPHEMGMGMDNRSATRLPATPAPVVLLRARRVMVSRSKRPSGANACQAKALSFPRLGMQFTPAQFFCQRHCHPPRCGGWQVDHAFSRLSTRTQRRQVSHHKKFARRSVGPLWPHSRSIYHSPHRSTVPFLAILRPRGSMRKSGRVLENRCKALT